MILELTAKQARQVSDPAMFHCNSSRDLVPVEGIIGQERALSALKFGLNMPKDGFNVFVSGLAGTGKTTATKSFLDILAAQKDTPPDWCYVYNFHDPYCPRALKVPPGVGLALQQDVKRLIEDAGKSLNSAFTSKEYADRRAEVTEALEKKREAAFTALGNKAQERGFLLRATQIGLIFVPLSNGKPMSEEEFDQLRPERKETLRRQQEELTKELKDERDKLREEERDAEKRLEDVDREVARYATSYLFEEVRKKYGHLPQVIEVFNQMEEDVTANFEQFRPEPRSPEAGPLAAMQGMLKKQSLAKYEVNVLVDNSQLNGAPVILELNPTFNNLFGRIEKEAQFGALYTDSTMIKSGSLHRANGGYLVVRIESLLSNFQSWEGIKRTLRDGKLVIEEIGERLGFIATKTLRPEPIPLDVKVVIIGEPMFYYLLLQMDSEFKELFKVKADFDTQMDKTEANLKDYVGVICRMCHSEDTRHLDSSALAKIVEYSSRLAGDQEKLSTLFSSIADTVREANFWASEDGDKTEFISAHHIMKAIEQRVYRSNLIQQRINEMINKGTIIIDVEGEKVGQVNGLEVLDLGDFAFGKPSRITASLGVGREGIVDIEREARLGGRIHSKGVMILNGYVTEKYAGDFPLSLSARLVFEQSYAEVEGDSASSTELYAIISRLAEAHIKQGIAVTGSVNQRGEVQAIGGVNEKIEGFFEICRAKGLTGEQGAMIPASNMRHLMLKESVVEAIAAGKFHIYSVSTIDEGIEVLSGMKAGRRLDDGTFEPDSINDRVQKRLATLAEKLRSFSRPDEKPEKSEKEPNTDAPKKKQ